MVFGYNLHAGNNPTKHSNKSGEIATGEIATRDTEFIILKEALTKYSTKIQKIQENDAFLVSLSRQKFLELNLVPKSIFATQETVDQVKAKLLKDFNIDFSKKSSRKEMEQATINHAKITQFIAENERTGDGFEISMNKINNWRIKMFLSKERICTDTDQELYDGLETLKASFESTFKELKEKETLVNKVQELKILLQIINKEK